MNKFEYNLPNDASTHVKALFPTGLWSWVFFYVLLGKIWLLLSIYPIPGYDDLNKRESRSPEGASKKVIAFLVNWFWIRFFKIFFLYFFVKGLLALIFQNSLYFPIKLLILIYGPSYSGDEDFNELEFLIFEDAFTQFSIFLAKNVLVEIFKVWSQPTSWDDDLKIIFILSNHYIRCGSIFVGGIRGWPSAGN